MLTQSRDTHKHKISAENRGRSHFYCYFKNIKFVHYRLHSSAECIDDEADEEVSVNSHFLLINKEEHFNMFDNVTLFLYITNSRLLN